MILQYLSLVNWSNGIIMISVFGAVCVGLVTVVLMLINSGNKK